MTGRNILALDIGAAGGWAVKARERRSGAWQFPQGRLERGQRFKMLRHFIQGIIRDNDIDCVIYERPFARGYHATRVLWGYAAVIEEAAAIEGVACVDVTPGQIKQFVTGKGNASKAQMTEAMRQRGYNGKNEHEADALCLLAYAEAQIEWPTEEERDVRDRQSVAYGTLQPLA